MTKVLTTFLILIVMLFASLGGVAERFGFPWWLPGALSGVFLIATAFELFWPHMWKK